MHELSIATAALDQALEEMRRAEADRIARIVLRIGRLSGVEAEALRFAFTALLPGTAAEGATLDIHDVPAVVTCSACARDFSPGDDFLFACPVCGQVSTTLKQGRELELTRLEFF
ncbi:MAG: hydrogenase maturation nickel metallochaperone HypA [Verrucomicrobia bacterium]|nr:hydrogenase maturation nickel metallochaperone HypA [Verrucomicrobiota bacterium]